ncbi:MAG: PilZ domain-containing protein [Rhodoblastus sp.]
MAFGSVGKRKAERRDCHVKAQIIRPDDDRPIDCLIMDFSATGARAKVMEPVKLPSRFKLYIPSRPETKNVLLRWQKDQDFGCEYSTGLADERTFFELIGRVDALESAGPAGDGAALADFSRRIEALEAAHKDLEAARKDQASPDAPQTDMRQMQLAGEENIAALEQRIEGVAAAAEGQARRSEQFLITRLEQTEDRLRALLAPDVPARLARLEALAESGAFTAAPASVQPVTAEFDPAIYGRLADLEARTMAMQRAADEAEARSLAHSVDDRAPPEAAAPGEVEDVIKLAERVSDIEVSLMELSLGGPAAPKAGATDLNRRITEIEERHAEIVATLRNLLGLLTASGEHRAAS